MDDTMNGTEDVEQIYETWRRGAAIPDITTITTGAMNETAFESLLKTTFVAGWVQRGRIPANTGARR